jgi:hypothetical protein
MQDISPITELIPQIAYDIVGRIVPGFIAILSFFITLMGPTRFFRQLVILSLSGNIEISGWIILAVIIFSYVLAFLLGGIWQIPNSVKHLKKSPPDPQFDSPSFSLKVDIIQHKLPKEGSWLVKLYAESNLCQILIITWSICEMINVYMLMVQSSSDRVWLIVFFLVAILCCLSARKGISITQCDSVKNYWLLLSEDKFGVD